MTTADRVLGSSGSSLACGLLSVRQKMTPPLWLGCLHKFRCDGETSKPENRIGGCTQLHHKLYKAKNKVKLNLGSPVISWCDSELKVWQTFSEQLNIWIHHSFSLCCVSTNAKISLLLCSKLHVLDFLFGFNQICTYFKQTSVLKIIKVRGAGWLDLEKHLQGADKSNVPCCLHRWIIIFCKTLLFRTRYSSKYLPYKSSIEQ